MNKYSKCNFAVFSITNVLIVQVEIASLSDSSAHQKPMILAIDAMPGIRFCNVFAALPMLITVRK